MLLGGWVLLLPPSTWHWKDCRVDWNYAAPVEKWIRMSETFPTQEECDARHSEVVKREQRRKPAGLARAHELEDHDPLRTIAPLFFDASTSAVCKAMADEWSHTRCRYLDEQPTSTLPLKSTTPQDPRP